MRIDPPVERNEICLVIGDEDSFFVNDQLVQDLVGDTEQVAVGCPYNPINLPRISFITSSVPPPIGPRRASRTARSMPYSRM